MCPTTALFWAVVFWTQNWGFLPRSNASLPTFSLFVWGVGSNISFFVFQLSSSIYHLFVLLNNKVSATLCSFIYQTVEIWLAQLDHEQLSSPAFFHKRWNNWFLPSPHAKQTFSVLQFYTYFPFSDFLNWALRHWIVNSSWLLAFHLSACTHRRQKEYCKSSTAHLVFPKKFQSSEGLKFPSVMCTFSCFLVFFIFCYLNGTTVLDEFANPIIIFV